MATEKLQLLGLTSDRMSPRDAFVQKVTAAKGRRVVDSYRGSGGEDGGGELSFASSALLSSEE